MMWLVGAAEGVGGGPTIVFWLAFDSPVVHPVLALELLRT
jgi:hypothetical protein